MNNSKPLSSYVSLATHALAQLIRLWNFVIARF